MPLGIFAGIYSWEERGQCTCDALALLWKEHQYIKRKRWTYSNRFEALDKERRFCSIIHRQIISITLL